MRSIYILSVLLANGRRQFWFGANLKHLNELIRGQWRLGRKGSDFEAGEFIFGAGLRPARVVRAADGVPIFVGNQKGGSEAELYHLRTTACLTVCESCTELRFRRKVCDVCDARCSALSAAPEAAAPLQNKTMRNFCA